MEKEEINKIEIRSEEVQEILGHVPSWIIRSGISVLFFVVFVLLIGSWFFKYPDIINSRITVTTKNPPAPITAKATGNIQELFVVDTQFVEKNKVIAIIENTADYEDVIKLKNKLKTINQTNFQDISFLNQNFILGELQQYYSTFSKQLKDYQNFIKLDYHNQKIKSVKKQIKDYRVYYNHLWKQKNILKKELKISKSQFNRDSLLYINKVYSKLDFEKSHQTYLQKKYSYEGARTSLANTNMQITQLEQQILDLKLQKEEQETQQTVNLAENLNNLQSQIANWEKMYLIISPIDGNVTFTKFWSANQNVQSGETVVTIVPKGKTNIIGKVSIPTTGVGKIKAGQVVNIKFDNFPYMEFGIIRGEINNISLVPEMTSEGVYYTAEIDMPDVLISNYGKQLKFSQEMTGTAEIITDDVRLLERFLQPLKSILKNNL